MQHDDDNAFTADNISLMTFVDSSGLLTKSDLKLGA